MRGVCPTSLAACALVTAALIGPTAHAPPAGAATPPGVEIVNVATSTYLAEEGGGGLDPPELHEATSNPVVTRVIAVDCFAPPLLEVDPAGTVAPGAALDYRLTVENQSGLSLGGVVVEMPLHPGLLPPVSYTDGLAPTADGGGVPCAAAYDPAAHSLTWTFPSLDPGARVSLSLATRIDPGLPADTLIEQAGEVFSTGCPERVPTNTVVTGVVPPILALTKRADRSTATVGDGVVYVFEIENTGAEPDLAEVVLVDGLPELMRYVAGSARVDGETVPDPEIGENGRTLRLRIGALEAGARRTVQLAAVVGPTSRRGEAVNHAVAEAWTAGGVALLSNRSTASVSVYPGPFRREAYLIGRVFVDDDGDTVPDEDEPGVPGVLVLLENGRGAVTDVTGRWHIEGVRPGLHVLRVDPGTLPPTLIPAVGGAEWAGDRLTRFVEARAATLVVADMPLGPPGSSRCAVAAAGRRLVLPLHSLLDAHQSIPSRAEQLIEAVADWLTEAGGPAGGDPTVSCAGAGPAAAGELEGRIAERRARRLRDIGQAVLRPGDDGPPAAASTREEPDRLERLLRTADPRPAILSPSDGTRAERSQIDVEVIHPLGTEPDLRVGGRPVDARRIGRTSVLESRQIVVSEYVGVALEEGLNSLEFRAVPPGAEPATVEPVRCAVALPGPPVELRIAVPAGRWIADGVQSGTLRVEALDGAGVRSATRMTATLFVEGARPLDADADLEEPGHQFRLGDGQAELRFAPLAVPGRVHVVVRAEAMELEEFIEVRPGAGTWRVTGLAEGNLAGDAGVEGDGGLAPGLEDDISGSGGRVAVFARGPLGRSSSLTVSLDTARERDRDRLENSFEPDAFFPVAGDAGFQTDEAASQGKLFARLDGPRGFVQWGDFVSRFDGTELLRYERRLTGMSGTLSASKVRVDGFASSSDQEVVRDVLAADGSSGPYLLSRSPIVARSETVIVEVRDRYQTDRVLSRALKRRDLEYDLDPVSGTLLFHGPVAPFDPDLNPVRIVVLYEARGGGGEQWTGGGRITYDATAKVRLGASAVVDERAGEDLMLYGADLVWRPRPGTVVEGEVAASSEQTSSSAVRLEVRSNPGPQLSWELAYRDLPADFNNPTYLGRPEIGSRRYGGEVEWRPDERWRVHGEAFVQEDEVRGLDRRVAGVDLERRVGPFTALGGLKTVATESDAAGDVSANLVKAGVRGYLGPRWTAELFREQTLGAETAPGYPNRTAAGVSWQVRDGTRAFLRQEFESGGGPDRDRTVLGLESRVARNTKALFHYSLDGTADGYALRAMSGVETVLPLSPRGSLSLSAARVDTTRGDDSPDYTSLAGGYAHQAGSRLFSARYELRLGSRETRHLLTASGALRPCDDWTLFARERFFLSAPEGAGSVWRAEGLFGAAYRPLGTRWSFLSRLDHSTSNGVARTPGGALPGSAAAEPSYSWADPTTVTVANGVGFGADRTAAGRDWIALSFAAGARLTARQRLAASLTLRQASSDPSVGLPSTLADLISLHYTAEVHRRWTVGGSLRRFSERESALTSFGQGLEVGYLAMKNLWVTGGYNFAGLKDGQFPGAEHTDGGPFLSLRFKFDERNLVPWADMRLDH